MAVGVPIVAIEEQIIPHEVMMRNRPHTASFPSKARGKTNIVFAAPITRPMPKAMVAIPDCFAMTLMAY
jgi:hypothetical protein